MTTFNEYWNGEVLACITPEQISDSSIKSAYSIKRWNLAFRFYYDGMATIKAFREASAHSEPGRGRSIKLANLVSGIRSSLVVRMKEDLEDTAREGWGMGVHEMREAFVHLASNDGRWTDKNWKSYEGELGRMGAGSTMGPACFTAACVANFLDAYEERLKEMGKHLNDMKNKASAAKKIMERVKNSNTVGTKEWNEFMSCLGEVKKVSSKVENRLWLYRLTCDPDSSGSKTLELREDALAGVGKCLSAIALVHGAVSDYNNALSNGLPLGEAIALTATTTAMEGAGPIAALFVEGTGTILGGMAILLAVYVAALRAIPGIHRQFTDMVAERDYRMAQFGVDMRPGH